MKRALGVGVAMASLLTLHGCAEKFPTHEALPLNAATAEQLGEMSVTCVEKAISRGDGHTVRTNWPLNTWLQVVINPTGENENPTLVFENKTGSIFDSTAASSPVVKLVGAGTVQLVSFDGHTSHSSGSVRYDGKGKAEALVVSTDHTDQGAKAIIAGMCS